MTRRAGALKGVKWMLSDVQPHHQVEDMTPTNQREAGAWLADVRNTDGCRTVILVSNQHTIVRQCVDHEFPATEDAAAEPCGMMWRMDEAWGWAMRTRIAHKDFDGAHAPSRRDVHGNKHKFAGETIAWVQEKLSDKLTAVQIHEKLVLKEVRCRYVNILLTSC